MSDQTTDSGQDQAQMASGELVNQAGQVGQDGATQASADGGTGVMSESGRAAGSGSEVVLATRSGHVNTAGLRPVYDSQSARALVNRRWDAYRAASERGAAAGAGVSSAAEAQAKIVQAQTELAIAGGRGSAASASYVSRQLEAVPDRRDAQGGPGNTTVVLVLSDSGRAGAAAALEEWHETTSDT